MTIEKVKEALKNNEIEDGENAIYFIMDLLEITIEDIEENEPYATTSIRQMKQAYESVRDLMDYIE